MERVLMRVATTKYDKIITYTNLLIAHRNTFEYNFINERHYLTFTVPFEKVTQFENDGLMYNLDVHIFQESPDKFIHLIDLLKI